MNMENRNYVDLFIAPIQLTDLDLNIDSLIEFCYEMKRKDEKGVELTNIGGWQSNDVFNETHTEFAKLKKKIEEEINVYHQKIQLKKNLEEKIGNIWININGKGALNEIHQHHYSILSGAFYLRGEAPIAFRHPYRDINTYFWDRDIIENWNVVNSGIFTVAPKMNSLLVFPAWVEHKVLMNKEETDRITISFNTGIQEIK